MPIGAAIGGIASVGSALIGSNAAQSAANTQAQAAQNAENTQLQMFNTAQAAEQPYNQVGQGAVNSLASLYGINGTSSNSASGGAATGGNTGAMNDASLAAFTNSPDYQFAFNQGLQGLQRSAAAGGTLISGGQLKAGQEFGQGLASQQFGNYYNRLLSLSQLGQSAASGQSNSAIQSGANIGNTQQALGQSLASGTVGSATALSGGLTGAAGSIGTSLLADKLGIGNQSLSSYNNSTANYAGLTDAGQDALQDSGYALP